MQRALSVTELLRPIVEGRQQFTTLEDAWGVFLHYLDARKGRDIRGFHRFREIHQAMEYVESGNLAKSSEDSPDADWFTSFERREDVLTGFGRFLAHRGLPLR